MLFLAAAEVCCCQYGNLAPLSYIYLHTWSSYVHKNIGVYEPTSKHSFSMLVVIMSVLFFVFNIYMLWPREKFLFFCRKVVVHILDRVQWYGVFYSSVVFSWMCSRKGIFVFMKKRGLEECFVGCFCQDKERQLPWSS